MDLENLMLCEISQALNSSTMLSHLCVKFKMLNVQTHKLEWWLPWTGASKNSEDVSQQTQFQLERVNSRELLYDMMIMFNNNALYNQKKLEVYV